jgi:hypothetical protein
VAQHPPVELRHHQVMLEHRQEFSRRQQRALLLAHANQDFAHRKTVLVRKSEDRLAVERELVFLERFAQAQERLRPSGELGARAVDGTFIHEVF